MPNKNTEKMANLRKKYDQVTFLAAKGTRELLRVLALRSGPPTAAADVMRRAVLAAAGLHDMPSADDLAALAAVKTPAEAEAAIQRLQSQDPLPAEEFDHEADKVYRWDVRINPDEWDLFLNISDQIEDALRMQNKTIVEHGMDAPGLDRIRISITADELVQLQRVVANMKQYILFTDVPAQDDQ